MSSKDGLQKRRGLLVRSDTLFTDAIERLLSDFPELNITILDFQQSSKNIPVLKPEVIIVDESLPSKEIEQVLALARELRECRVIMLNPARNEFVLVNSHRATIKKVEDFMKAIHGEKKEMDLNTSAEEYLQRAESAHARAEMYGFLAHMFNQQPTPEFVGRLRALGLDAFSPDEETTPDISLGLQEIDSFIKATSADSEEMVQGELAVDWTRLFRGVSPGYGPPPPYEGVHSEGKANQAEVLQAVVGIYQEYSVNVDEKAANRPDYIGIELDFQRHLNKSEATAWELGDDQTALGFQEAERYFLLNHLGRWAWKFCDLAIEEAKTDFYRGFARLTKGVLNEEMEMLV